MEKLIEINEHKIYLIDKMPTSFEDGSMWQWYRFEGSEYGKEVVLQGVILTPKEIKNDEKTIAASIYGFVCGRGGILNFPKCNMLNPWFAEQMTGCYQSDNDMWFVEEGEASKKNLKLAESDVKKFNLDIYVEFGVDAAMTIYGGAIQCINWAD